jgi:hypothetical protein
MTERERLRAALIALVAEDALILEAQAEVTRYLSKEFEAAELVNRLIRLLDGPDQYGAYGLTASPTVAGAAFGPPFPFGPDVRSAGALVCFPGDARHVGTCLALALTSGRALARSQATHNRIPALTLPPHLPPAAE